MKKKISIFTTIFVIIFVIIFFDKIVDFVIDIKWYKEVGYLKIYFTKILATFKLMIPVFIISYFGIWLYYRSLRGSIERIRDISDMSIEKRKLEKKIFVIFNFIISFALSYVFSANYWYRILQFTNSSKFRIKDPIFGLDVSFFIFKLPLIESIYTVIMSLLGILVIFTIVVYFIMNAKDRISYEMKLKNLKNKNFMKSGLTKFAGKQLAIVSALITLFLSLGYLIKSWNLVYSPRGVVFGAGYTDTKVTLNFYKVIIVVSLITSIVILVSVLKAKIKPIIISIVILFTIIILEGVTAVSIQNFIVKSNERSLEEPYIKYNIEYTRKAFNLENIVEKNFDVKENLTKEDLLNNKETIENIKVNSYNQALEFYNQVQVIRYYYDFYDLDVDRYNIDGKFTQVFVAPREIDLNTLDGNANTWQNKHLNYTHGYGIVMNKVNSVTSQGQPSFIIKDIPPDNSTGIKLENPRIYFGEKTNEYAIVNTVSGEFDYPKSGDENEINKYKGKSGIKMNIVNKVLFAIKERNLNFLLSREINSDSKILINRNIVKRVKKIAPFLTYDKDPYMVINDGKLYWIIDAFTMSDRYPFSQPDKSGVNYIRNSIKVVMDAEDGTTNFYIIDKDDPIAQSYLKIFPSLFKDYDKIPKGIVEHFRYPEDLFNIQCKILGKYHVTDADVFYKSEDLWEIAKNQKEVKGQQETTETSYVVMRLPGEKNEEMILLEYFNMRERPNMAALFGARMDRENYGKMVLYKLPSKKTIFSPYLFKQKLIQDASISKELSLWNKGGGSKVQYGDTVIVPINESLLYVEPIYLRAEGKKSIPEMKRVIVSYADKLVIAENIEEALKKLFDTEVEKTKINEEQIDSDVNINNLNDDKFRQAKELYDKAIESQKNGDWAQYGEYIEKLGEILSKTK